MSFEFRPTTGADLRETLVRCEISQHDFARRVAEKISTLNVQRSKLDSIAERTDDDDLHQVADRAIQQLDVELAELNAIKDLIVAEWPDIYNPRQEIMTAARIERLIKQHFTAE